MKTKFNNLQYQLSLSIYRKRQRLTLISWSHLEESLELDSGSSLPDLQNVYTGRSIGVCFIITNTIFMADIQLIGTNTLAIYQLMVLEFKLLSFLDKSV